jgi:hypothetical protein
MREYYAFDVIRRQTSRFDGQPFYEVGIVGIDPEDRHLKVYKTYVVTGYENFNQWLPIINAAAPSGQLAWFSGNMRTKQWHPDTINADSVPFLEDVIQLKRFERFVQHNCNIGAIKNTRPERELNEVGKQFFEV